MRRLLSCVLLACLMSAPSFGELINGDFEYWSDHPDAGDWAYVTTIQDDPDVAWTTSGNAWLDDGYAGYQHIIGTSGDRMMVISWGDTTTAVAQNVGINLIPGETYTFIIDIYGESAGDDAGGQGAGEHWCIGIGPAEEDMPNAVVRQQSAFALAASNATWNSSDMSDYTVLNPPDVFAGWQTRQVSYTATAEDAGKEFSVFFSGGFQAVGADPDTCFDNARIVVGSLDAALAGRPYPARGDTDVPRNTVLTWTPGMYVAQSNGHRVYFSEVLDEVDQSLGAADQGLFSAPEFPTEDLGLEFDKTYYWRVDEVNATPDKTVHRGDVWSFTLEPYSIQIPGSTITVTASSMSSEFSPPERTIDGSGLDANDMHSTNTDNMWYTANVDLAPWIQFEFDSAKKLDTMKIWNANSTAESAIGWGVKDVEIAYSADGENWSVLEDANQLSRAPGVHTYDQYDEIPFNGTAAKYVRLNILSNWGGVLMSYGLSEVQFNMIPVQARSPVPASGSVDVLPDTVAQWRAGRDAVQHTIYMNTDPNAVANGSGPSVSSGTNSLDLSTLDLHLETTYYWRVDEVNEADATPVWPGPVWSLSTPSTLIVDDFEDYNNFSPDRPFQTWLDGAGYSADEHFPTGYGGNGTGAGVGHDIWSLDSPHYNGQIMETSINMPGSSLSMPFYYNNAGGAASHIDRSWSAPQDWSGHGIQTLVLYFYGAPGNTGDLYLKINDTKIAYNGDPSNLTRLRWNPWHIDLSTLAVSSVSTVSIGVDGNGANGMLLLDNLLLYRKAPELTVPVAPSTDGLVAHWKLDEGAGTSAGDSAGSHHATIKGIVQWTTGQLGGALVLDGMNTYADCGSGAALDITDTITLSAWVKPQDAGNGEHNPYIAKGDHTYALKHGSGNSFEFFVYNEGTWNGVNVSVTDGYNDNWYHLAGTFDGTQLKMYINGVLSGTTDYEGPIATSTDAVNLGRNSEETDRLYEGTLDDARIYNRALSEAEVLYLSNQ